MKNLKQIRKTYDYITEKSEKDQRNLDALVEAGLFEEKKLPVLKRILESSADKMTGSEKRFVVNLLESIITQYVTEAKNNPDYLAKYDKRGPKDWPSDSDLPPVLILKRKAIRVYPDNTKVALYYAQAIDRYVSVPYGGKGHIMAVNEAVSDDDKRRPVPTKKKLDPIATRKDLTAKDLPAIRSYLMKQTLTSNSPVRDAMINLGAYAGMRYRLKKAAKIKQPTEKKEPYFKDIPRKPPTPSKGQKTLPSSNQSPSPFASQAAGVWSQRRLTESFKDRLETLREAASAPTMPQPGIDFSGIVKKYGPTALKVLKRYGPSALRATPAGRVAGAFLDMIGTAGSEQEREWEKASPKDRAAMDREFVRKQEGQKRAKAEADKQQRTATYDALKDATKQKGAEVDWSKTYSGTKEAQKAQQRVSQKKAEVSSRAMTYPGMAGTIGMGDLTKVQAPTKKDVDRAKDAETAAKAKGGSTSTDVFRDASKAAGAKGKQKDIAVPQARNDVPPTAIEKKLASQEKARSATSQAQSQAAAQAGQIAAAQSGAKTKAQDSVDADVKSKAQSKADSKARTRDAVETLTRARDRTRPRLGRRRGFRLPDISLPSSPPGPKEPGPNYAFGLKPPISTPTPVSNRAAVDRWMDIINRKANQAMLRENTPERRDDDEEVGTAGTTQDGKAVYNFRKRPRVGSSKATSATGAVERWMERIARQANQAMLRQQDQQNESVYGTIENMVENNIAESQIVFGEQSITINNTVARKLVSIHEAMNKKNKKKMEEMLNESASSFQKVLTFAVRH